MMNSNNVIIAYLENHQPFACGDSYIPNKMWRSYFYITKDILMNGYSYPHEDKDTTKYILHYLKDLVKDKFN